MKGVIKFLLNTAVGRELVGIILRALINLFKKKVLDKMRENPRLTLEQVLKIADEEIHADLESAKPTDLLK